MGIVVKNLTKKYGGKTALDEVSLSIGNGMFGLLGPNGAGKTTLMRILTTLIPPTSGEVSVNGIPVAERARIRGITGYLPQDFSFYPSFNVYECLDYLGILSGIRDNAKRKKRIEELLAKVNLYDKRNEKVRKLSGGMLRRLGIAQALLHEPEVCIVDEPTAGLDPEERIRFRNMLSDLSGDRIVILSTHIVEDIEFTCSNLAVLNEGKVEYCGSVGSFVNAADGFVWSANVGHEAMDKLKRSNTILSAVTEGNGFRIRLLAGRCPLEGATPVCPTIEDAYMKTMKGEGLTCF